MKKRKMCLTAIFYVIILILAASNSYTQTVRLTPRGFNGPWVRYLDEHRYYAWTYCWYRNIGRADGTNGTYSASQEDIYRTSYEFNLDVIPSNAIIQSVGVYVTFPNYITPGYTARIVSLSRLRSYREGWDDIVDGSTLLTGVPYTNTQVLTTSALTNAVLNAGRGPIYVGVHSNNESSSTSGASVLIELQIQYTVPPSIFNITTQNSFGGGYLYVDGHQVNSGRLFPWTEGTNHTINAFDGQMSGNYVQRFTNWSGLSSSSSISLSVTATRSGTYQAEFLNEYNLKFTNSYGSGQLVVDGTTQTSGYQKPIRQFNSVSFSTASKTTLNGWEYTLANWTANSAVVASPNIPTDHINFVANYSKKLLPMAQVNGTTVVDGEGTHPKITWSNAGLAPEVTGYKIYQKFGKTGSIYLLANVSGRNTTEYIDYGVNLTPTVTNPINYYVSAISGTYESAQTRCSITYFGVWAPKLQPFDAENTHDYISDELPTSISLLQNYPNPWNPTTTITFALPAEDNVKLVIYDMLGREVKTLVDGNCSAGYHSVELDGSRLSSGMYFYKLQVGSHAEMKKMQLIK